MRVLPLILLGVVALSAIVLYREYTATPVISVIGSTDNELPAILEIRSYTDADFQFTMAVPAQWRQIVAVEPESEIDKLETSYAVGFESARTSQEDRFADYIMIEIIPGVESGAFDTGDKPGKQIYIDGLVATEDTLLLDGFEIDGHSVDLQVYQAELYRLGYTIGFYAIGEHREAAVLRDAFRLMVETFKLPPNLFDLS